MSHLKQSLVGKHDCSNPQLFKTIRKRVLQTGEAVRFGPVGSAVNFRLHTMDATGRLYILGEVAFTHIAPSDALSTDRWLSNSQAQQSPIQRRKWCLLSAAPQFACWPFLLVFEILMGEKNKCEESEGEERKGAENEGAEVASARAAL